MRQRDPKFIDPIISGVAKRPAREKKRARLLYRITEGDMSGKKIDYEGLSLSGNFLLSVHNYPDTWRAIHGKPLDSLIETISDLEEVLLKTDQERNGKNGELPGLTNALVCTHDVLHGFEEAGVDAPKEYRMIRRRLGLQPQVSVNLR